MDAVAHETMLKLPDIIPGYGINEYVDVFSTPQLRTYFDKAQRAVWSRWSPQPRPCFNHLLLQDLRAYYDLLEQSGAKIQGSEGSYPLEYAVMASGTPGVFILGGDLSLFKSLIEKQDRAALMHYGRSCVDCLYSIYSAYNLPVTTICLIQGECLGGGFEVALSNDVLIAEKSARFGFPEILFNLFPGMGAYSFLERRVGRRITEELLSSGKIYSADEMMGMGVVDFVVEDGDGEMEVAELIKRRQRNFNGLTGIAAARRRVQKLDFSELMDVVEIWVGRALSLTSRDMKLMQRLVGRQNGLVGQPQLLH